MNNLSGQTLKGYEIRESIGAGGFGAVYLAFQTVVQREVAVKVILPEYANQPEFIRNFEVEAQIVARLEHPHIIPLFDYWRDPDGAYLVMRYLRGGSLTNRLKQGQIETDDLLKIVEQVTAGLAAAHRAGVVHRDIKPDNILLDEEGNAYLTDFGIAKTSGHEASSDNVSGSLAYMSPEQLMSAPPTPQADLYSIGVVIFEMLTGQHPFDGSSPSQLIMNHMNDPLPDVQMIRPDLPESVNEVIQKATAKEPANRYTDARQIAVALAKAFRAGGIGDDAIAVDPGEIVNPYKGLRAFQEADSADFFGREALVNHLLSRIEEQGAYSRFMAVVGPSGSGKSSVVRAGLVPALRRGAIEGSENWFIVDMVPGSNPIRQLEAALLSVALRPPTRLFEMLSANESGLLWAADLITSDVDGDLLIIIDQFEEVFTMIDDEEQRLHFLNLIRVAIEEPDSRLRVVITMRADFTDRPLEYVEFGELIRRRTEFVLPMSPDEIERAITGPAARVGLQVDTDLIAAIVADVREEPGALPLLQYALTEIFQRREGTRLTFSAYQESGGVLGALARRAEEVYVTLSEEERAIARQMCLRMITLGEGTEDTRRRASRSELADLVPDHDALQGVLDAFGQYRLLTFDVDPDTREPMIEVAHEALIREWDRLRGWLDNSRSDVRLQRVLAGEAAEWGKSGRDASFLLGGARLTQYEEWAETTDIALTSDERAYLAASIEERQRLNIEEQARKAREEETAQRAEQFAARSRQLTRAAVALAAVFVLAVIATFVLISQVATTQTQVAEGQTEIAGVVPTLAAAETQVAGVAPTLDAAAVQIASADEQVAAAETQIAGVVPTLDAAETQIAGVQPTLDAAQLQITTADEQVAAAQTQVADADAQIIAAEAQIAAVVPTLDAAQTQVAGVEPTLDAAGQRVAAADEQVIAAETQVARAEVQVAGAETQVAAFEPTVIAAETQIAGVQPTLDAAQLQITTADEQVAAAQTQVADADAQIIAAEAQIAAVVPTLDAAQTQVAGVEPTLAAAETQIAAADEQVIAAETQVAGAEVQVAGAETQVAAFEPTVIAAETQIAGVQPTLDSAQAQIAAVVPTLAAAETQVAGVAPTLDAANQQLAFADQQIAAAETQVAGAEGQVALVETQVAVFEPTVIAAETQIAGVQPTLDSAQAQIAAVVPTLAAAETQVAGVEPTLDAANVRVAAAETQIAGVEPTLDAAQTQIAGVVPTLESAETQIAGVQPTLQAVQAQVADQQAIANALRLVRSAEQLLATDNPDLAIALLLEAYRLNPNLGETQRLLSEAIPLTVRLDLNASRGLATFSPDERFLTVANGSTLEIWNPQSRQRSHELAANATIRSLIFSPDGQRVATGLDNGIIIVWDAGIGVEVQRLNSGNSSPVIALDYHPTEQRLIAGTSNGVAYLWDIDGAAIVQQIERGHEGAVERVAFNENGSAAHSYDFSRPRPQIGVFRQGVTPFYRAQPNYRGLSENGQIGFTGADGSGFFTIWNADNGVSVRVFQRGNANTDYINQVAFSPDGQSIAVHVEGRNYVRPDQYTVTGRHIGIWRVGTGEELLRLPYNLEDPTGWDVSALAWSPDSRLLMVGARIGVVQVVSLWDVATATEINRFRGHQAPVTQIEFSGDMTYALSISTDNNARVWDIGREEPNVVRRWQNIRVSSLDQFGLSVDGELVYIAYDNQSMVTWNLATDSDVSGSRFFTGSRRLLEFSPFAPLALVVTTDGVTLWDMDTRQARYRIEGIPPANVRSAVFSADGQSLYIGTTTITYRWDINLRRISQQMRHGAGSLAVDNNDEYVLLGARDGLQVWDLLENRVDSLANTDSAVTAVAFSPDGSQIAVGLADPDNSVLLFNFNTRNLIFTLIGHRAGINDIQFSTDGRSLLSASDDNTLILWDVSTGQIIRQYNGHSTAVQQALFSPAGGLAISRSLAVDDGLIGWQVETAQDTVNRAFASRYIPDITCQQRLQYNVEPFCVDEIIPTALPSPTPQATPTPLPTATPRPSPTATQTPIPTGIVRTDGGAAANLRAEPSAGAALIAQVPSGTRVQIIETRSDLGWVNVRLPDGTTGWLLQSLVR